MDPALFQALRWRCIGPPRGGRVVAVAGHPTEPMVFYFGAVAGGVWKTTDGGTYWENVSDGYFRTAAIGALAVAESDPNVVYAGTGEATIRIDVVYGDGVYKSTDGGRTWAHVGLADTRHIGKIRVHPRDPDLVYVAALGHAFGPNRERGVYRSRDGGRSWQQVLFRSDKAGAIDIALDPSNPRILYATTWEVFRHFWTLSSGGPDSRLYKSTDGGDTWTDITDNPGLPRGIKGKIGVTVAPRGDRVWAIVEAQSAGLYRSDDGGRTWECVSDNRDLIHRPWYYCHVFADPVDPDTVYVTNLKMWKSTDGGRTFTEVTTPHGDNHDLWIDPRDPRRMIEGNDGGACVSFNGGQSWSTIYNQLTAQFYHLATDDQHPYRVYGTQQDNSSVSVPSSSENGGITWGDCYPAGTGESGYIAVHPKDPNVVYVGAVGSSPGGGGALQRYDHRTRQIRLVTVWPEVYYGWGAKDLRYRFAWTFPIVFSPHDPGTLYATGNLVFRTRDEGSSWEAISPDLTRNDVTKLEASGGPLTKDTSGAEHYATVYAFAESPRERGVLWAGSDDGLVHVSRDDGKTWQNVTPPELPESALIATIEPSPHAPGTVYLAATRYKIDDYRPYLFKTEDHGRTWRSLTAAFPAGEISRVIREDPVRPGLLFVGTETGVVVSRDNGRTWQRGAWNLPVSPVYDLGIKGGDLVAATHGRSFWVLDDLTPLRERTAGAAETPHLFAPRPTVRPWQNWSVDLFRGPGKTYKNYMMALGTGLTFYEDRTPEGERVRTFLDAGENPPQGAIVYYALGDPPGGPVSLTFLDDKGAVIRTFTTKPETPPAANAGGTAPGATGQTPPAPPPDERYVTARPGLNRFVWDLRYPGAEKVPGDVSTEKAITGPLAPPGRYQVRLTVGERSWIQPLEVRKDPRVSATQAELDAQFALWRQIRDTLSETHAGINRLRRIRRQVSEWSQRLRESPPADGSPPRAGAGSGGPPAAGAGNPGAPRPEGITEAADRLLAKLAEIETELVQTSAKNSMDALRWPARLNLRLVSLMSVLSSADAAPPRQAREVYEHLAGLARRELARLDALVETDVAAFNALVREANLPAIATR